MELLSLELSESENRDLIKNIKIITNIEESDINIELSQSSENHIKIRYFLNDGMKNRDYLEKVIGKITKYLIEYTKIESIKYLKDNYFYFDEEEFDAIIETIEEEIDNDIKIQLIIKNKFKEILENTKTINLNGFINFRLKFIKLYVTQIVEKCIDSYLMKKEYLDFISIIRLISDSEDKEHEAVNIFYNNNKLQVYDNNMKKITYITNVETAKELDSTLSYDETIINILLSISPKKIILHTSNVDKNDVTALTTLEVVKKIFNGKLESCNGCKYCNS